MVYCVACGRVYSKDDGMKCMAVMKKENGWLVLCDEELKVMNTANLKGKILEQELSHRNFVRWEVIEYNLKTQERSAVFLGPQKFATMFVKSARIRMKLYYELMYYIQPLGTSFVEHDRSFL